MSVRLALTLICLFTATACIGLYMLRSGLIVPVIALGAIAGTVVAMRAER